MHVKKKNSGRTTVESMLMVEALLCCGGDFERTSKYVTCGWSCRFRTALPALNPPTNEPPAGNASESF